ncbi:deoxyribodipyrimidine photo-lyase-like [Pelobates fuscus]|uniref:deoxyribodipyrimidine photo-lyase-like n=1 Tax=Pelobates fuscus TaxID=191477 RepID=UPI002FE4B1A3
MADSGYNVSQMEVLMEEMLSGSIEADEYFCMVLSLLGRHRTYTQLPEMVKGLREQNPPLYSQLIHIHSEYFQEEPLDSETLDCDIDLELAIALSLQENSSREQINGVLTSIPTQRYQREIMDPKISYSEALKKSSVESQNIEKPLLTSDVILKDNLGTRLTPERLQINEEKRNEPDHSYSGQPEPEDCVLPLNDNGNLFNMESLVFNSSKAKKSRRGRKKKNSAILKSPGTMRPVLVWFRRDLRLHDNPALIATLEHGVPVIPVFLWSLSEESGQNFTLASGGATKYWLHHALLLLDETLKNRFGSQLICRVTESCVHELATLVKETGAATVIVNSVYEPWLKERDDHIEETLKKQRVVFKKCHSYCLYEPYSVSTEGVGLRGIGSVTHFMACCKRNPPGPIGIPVEAPTCLPVPSCWPGSVDIDKLNLARMPRRKDGTVIDWAATIRTTWDFSEDGAFRCLGNFLEDGVKHYEKESGRADKPYTSHISPYLHFGQISPRTVLHEAHFTKKNVPKFLRKLAWRDLAYWLLVLFPEIPTEPVRPAYKSQRWCSNQIHLEAWQKGKTGYPLVDAAMRELWLTGWMSNYSRHVVASFLVAYLHIHWVHGYRWFQDTLVDADVAINAMMWQNGGMSGLDHWNFVMHPVDAALTCDPYGTYTRKWCPELAGLPNDYIHKPWKCPPAHLRRAGVILGENYPHRLVMDLEERREQSLKDVVEVRQKHVEYIDKFSGCDMIPIPDHLLASTLGHSGGEDEVIKNQTDCFLLPVITRKEFKYKTLQPSAKDNPYNTVLKGYVGRKRDETIAYMNERHFTASTINEVAQMYDRRERTTRLLEGLPLPKENKNKSRRTTKSDSFSVIPPAYFHLSN